MGQILWTCHFLAAQGQNVPTTTIYQGNKSTILLAENDNSSSSKKKHHFNVRYYFITYQIKKGHLKVAFAFAGYAADLFTKPLQGALFICMQEKGLNLPASESINMHRTVLEDRKIKYEKEKDTQGTRGGRVCQESRGYRGEISKQDWKSGNKTPIKKTQKMTRKLRKLSRTGTSS